MSREYYSNFSLVTGCMFAGKTSYLIREIKMWKKSGKIPVVLKPEIDNRYGKGIIAAHDGKSAAALSFNGNISEMQDALRNMYTTYGDSLGIFIDEISLFPLSFIELIKEFCKLNVIIKAVGLDMDYKGNPFEIVEELSKFAAGSKLFARCAICDMIAKYTYRISPSTERVLIGGPGMYEPRCEEHWSFPTY